jgi:hypothetical protein
MKDPIEVRRLLWRSLGCILAGFIALWLVFQVIYGRGISAKEFVWFGMAMVVVASIPVVLGSIAGFFSIRAGIAAALVLIVFDVVLPSLIPTLPPSWLLQGSVFTWVERILILAVAYGVRRHTNWGRHMAAAT